MVNEERINNYRRRVGEKLTQMWAMHKLMYETKTLSLFGYQFKEIAEALEIAFNATNNENYLLYKDAINEVLMLDNACSKIESPNFEKKYKNRKINSMFIEKGWCRNDYYIT